ncbi:hypothetical protein CCUS01_08254 [Colletotrichum cuscutae]|uniref:C2H2-type domain-containing protein n=1 Tax=Colletotrichum cuscutae TaxID=1209917 RepID=A0AAI9UWY8_9PEZI|nr:hypothetical protein CCUS01_08254 [Colletotrichum cuscutae]
MSRCQATDVSKLRRIFGWMRMVQVQLWYSFTPQYPSKTPKESSSSTLAGWLTSHVRFLQAQSSGPFINKQDSCRDITTACIAQLTQSLTLADETLERLQHLHYVAQGFYGLLPYAHGYWIEHLLEYLELSQGFRTPDFSSIQEQLMALTRNWIDLLGEEAMRISNAESHDSRLHWLEILPSTRALVQEALELRKATKESVGITRYHTCVIELLTESNFPSLLAEDFIAFKEEYGPSAFVCSVYGCDRAVVGCSSDEQLKVHLTRHQEKPRCFKQDCFYNDVGFNSQKQLKDHQRRCHPSPPLPSIPRQISHTLGQQSPPEPSVDALTPAAAEQTSQAKQQQLPGMSGTGSLPDIPAHMIQVTPTDIMNARKANPKIASLTDNQLRDFIIQIKKRQMAAAMQKEMALQREVALQQVKRQMIMEPEK